MLMEAFSSSSLANLAKTSKFGRDGFWCLGAILLLPFGPQSSLSTSSQKVTFNLCPCKVSLFKTLDLRLAMLGCFLFMAGLVANAMSGFLFKLKVWGLALVGFGSDFGEPLLLWVFCC